MTAVRCTLPDGDYLSFQLNPSSTVQSDIRPHVSESLGHSHFLFIVQGTIPPQRLSADDERKSLGELKIRDRSALRVLVDNAAVQADQKRKKEENAPPEEVKKAPISSSVQYVSSKAPTHYVELVDLFYYHDFEACRSLPATMRYNALANVTVEYLWGQVRFYAKKMSDATTDRIFELRGNAPLELINVKKRCVSPFILRIEPPATTAKDFLEINSIQEAKRCRLLDYPENTIVRVITEFDKENNRPREPTPPPVEGDKWEVRCVLPNGDKLNLTELCAQSTLGKDVRPLVEDSLGRTDFIFMGATVPPVAYSGEDERRPLGELDVSHRTVIKVKWVDAEHVYRP